MRIGKHWSKCMEGLCHGTNLPVIMGKHWYKVTKNIDTTSQTQKLLIAVHKLFHFKNNVESQLISKDRTSQT